MFSSSLMPRSLNSLANNTLTNDSLNYLPNASEVLSSNFSDDIHDPTKSAIFVPVFGPFDRVVPQMPLSGYPGPMFHVIHISAVISLSLSTLVGMFLIAYLFIFGNHGKMSSGERTMTAETVETAQMQSIPSASAPGPGTGSSNRISFWKWNFSERLVIYLAVADLGFTSFHLIDKWYYLLAVANPPDGLCSMVGFFFNQFMFSQWIVIMFAAVNACSLVVFNKKLNLGRWDWKLILIAFGTPLVGGAIELRLGLLGQSGAWCFIDYRTKAGKTFAQVVGIIEMATFGILAVCYGAIWMKIRQSSKVVDASIERCNRTAKIMMIFVLTFLFQWWVQILIVVWVYIFGSIPSFMSVISGCLVNLGGVYDCVAYTVIRRIFQKRVSPT